MNASIAYALTILAAICIPVALVLVPTAQAAGVAAVLFVSIGEMWRRAVRNNQQAIARAVRAGRPRSAACQLPADQAGD